MLSEMHKSSGSIEGRTEWKNNMNERWVRYKRGNRNKESKWGQKKEMEMRMREEGEGENARVCKWEKKVLWKHRTASESRKQKTERGRMWSSSDSRVASRAFEVGRSTNRTVSHWKTPLKTCTPEVLLTFRINFLNRNILIEQSISEKRYLRTRIYKIRKSRYPWKKLENQFWVMNNNSENSCAIFVGRELTAARRAFSFW